MQRDRFEVPARLDLHVLNLVLIIEYWAVHFAHERQHHNLTSDGAP
jgi:hypothetical protein